MSKTCFRFAYDSMIYQDLGLMITKILSRHLEDFIPTAAQHGDEEEITETCEKLKEFCEEYIDAEREKFLRLLRRYSE